MLFQFCKSNGAWTVVFAGIFASIVTLATGIAVLSELNGTVKNNGEKAILDALYQQTAGGQPTVTLGNRVSTTGDDISITSSPVTDRLRAQFAADPERQYAFQYVDEAGDPTSNLLNARYLFTGFRNSGLEGGLLVVVEPLLFAERLLNRLLPLLAGLAIGLILITFLISFLTFRRFQISVSRMVTYIDVQSEALDPARHVPQTRVQGLHHINRRMIDHFEKRQVAEERAAKARSDALSVIDSLPHDFRNRIAALRQRLKGQMSGPDADIAGDALNEADIIFNELTDLQKAMFNHLEDVQHQDLSQAVTRFFDDAVDTLKAADLTLTMAMQHGLSTHFSVPLLETILRNLVENAMKYTLTHGEVMVGLTEIEDGIELTIVSSPAIGCSLPPDRRLGETGVRASEVSVLIKRFLASTCDQL